MKKNVKSLVSFERYKLKNENKIIGGEGDDPSEGDGKSKPPPPPGGPFGPVIIKG